MIKDYKNSSYYNNVVELYNEEEVEEEYKQLSIDTVYEWFYKKSKKSNINISLYTGDDIDSTIKNIVDIMIVLPNKQKYGLVFVYDIFTVDEYENIKNILKNNNIIPFFIIGHCLIHYIPSYHISLPDCFQQLIDDNQVMVIINPVSQTLNYCVNNDYEFLFDVSRDDNTIITFSIDDCNFSPKTGFVFDGFNDYYKSFISNVKQLQEKKLQSEANKKKIIEKVESEEVKKHRLYYLIDQDLKRKDYYGVEKLNNHSSNHYYSDGTVNYGVLLKDLEDIDDYDNCHDTIDSIKWLKENDIKNVNFWKVYTFYRLVNNIGSDYNFVHIFQLVKYAARELVFTVSPAAFKIHDFLEELVDEGYLEKKKELDYSIVNNNFDDSIIKKYLD